MQDEKKKEFHKILAVHSGKETGKHIASVSKVLKILEKRQSRVIHLKDLAESDVINSDLVITIGGDGTFVRTARFIDKTPILGINSDPESSEGALASIIDSQIHELENILSGKYDVIVRERAQVKLNGKMLKELALNEVYIGASSQFHTSRYIIKFKEQEEEQRSSGVLIATGSGSHAWYKSVGGKQFGHDEKKISFIVREPFFGKLFQPKILYGELHSGEKIDFISKRHHGGIIAIDSYAAYDFNNDDWAEIELSDRPLNVIVPSVPK